MVVTSEALGTCERLVQDRYSAMRQPEVEPATCWLQVQRPNHYTTEPHIIITTTIIITALKYKLTNASQTQVTTMQLGLCSMRRGDSTPSRYCTSCIGCQSSSGSHTRWQFWRTKFGARPLRFIYTAESQDVPAAELYVQLHPSRC